MGVVFLFFTYTKIRTENIVRGKNIKNFVIVGTLISYITISIIILLTYTSITMIIFRILFRSR